jgi:type IV secretory pathway TraG/TraD family ATPase VirD4
VGLGVLVVGFLFALPRDRKRRRVLKYGRRTKGPEQVTAAQFNRSQSQAADGIGFITKERRTLGEFILRRDGKMVRVPRERESYHFMMMGDTGAGKSSLIRQILMQIEGRGETAIVYDPQLEYTPQFYEPGRGDVILNPLDARMPYWSPCDEVQHEAEAEGLAAALFKDDPRTNPFFVMVPRQIFAHLLNEQPKRTPQELLAVLRDERELAKRLKDTEHAAAIYPDAGPQRGGMIATLNSVTNALKLLPRKEEAKTSWTATEWAKQRQGWLFITSPSEFRERLRPLISMWLDMLVLRLMNQGQPGARPVWFILDELHSLHALPQLHTAITESRKAKNPVVLGFQGRSQLEDLYGRKAEAMLSQPATKIFLRTDEANSSEWISQTIGDQEIERLRESRMEGHFPNNRRDSRSYQLDRSKERLVMASEIQGLPDLHGYVKGGNLVVRLSFPYIDLPKRHEAFIERKLAPQQLKEEPAEQATASPSNGDGSFTRPIPGQSQARNMPPPIPPQREEPPKQPSAQAGDDDLPLLDC